MVVGLFVELIVIVGLVGEGEWEEFGDSRSSRFPPLLGEGDGTDIPLTLKDGEGMGAGVDVVVITR